MEIYAGSLTTGGEYLAKQVEPACEVVRGEGLQQADQGVLDVRRQFAVRLRVTQGEQTTLQPGLRDPVPPLTFLLPPHRHVTLTGQVQGVVTHLATEAHT